jgi:uncharacterized protein
MYLLDTNIWLERLLDQERSTEVGHLLDHVSSEQLHITDFSFHSIGVVLSKLSRLDVLARFVRDTFVDGSVALARLGPEDMPQLIRAAEAYGLDFDDAYQYAAAEKHDLLLVSFDQDFDRTDLGRKTPAEILRS